MMRRILHWGMGSALLVMSVGAQNWGRNDVRLSDLEKRAKDLAGQAYEKPSEAALPTWLRDLNFDEYRDIRFRKEYALWSKDPVPFRAEFLSPGYLFAKPVKIMEYTDTHEQEVRFTSDYFTFGPVVTGKVGAFAVGTGFSGWRLHAPLNRPDYFDEVAVFQGESYWRAVGRGQAYGLSARGVAINTGLGEGVAEEFPRFREFWLKKPKAGESKLKVLALLDGESVTGAYSFEIEPGADTIMTVHAVLFLRREVKRFAIAPITSMFWYGENSRRRYDDYRVEVHDSDGLLIRDQNGVESWRPLEVDKGWPQFHFFDAEHLGGFGLMQRDRNFENYSDTEVPYQNRPSLWIEPLHDWGRGRVMLMENQTNKASDDNIGVMWVPDVQPKVGEAFKFSYRQYWTKKDTLKEKPLATVAATRTGEFDNNPNERTFAIDFKDLDEKLLRGAERPQAVVEVQGPNRERVRVVATDVVKLPNQQWRVIFHLASAKSGDKLRDVGMLNLRAYLKWENSYLSETWMYQIEL